jgi:hypothetical protein
MQVSVEYQTLQEWLLGPGMCWVRFTKAVCKCSKVGNTRGKLHRALRDLKREGRRLLDCSSLVKVCSYMVYILSVLRVQEQGYRW